VTIGFGGGKILTDCDLNVNAGPWSLPDNDAIAADCPNTAAVVTLTFHSRAINLPAGSVTDSEGGTYGVGTISGSPNQNQVTVTRTAGTNVGTPCTVSVDDVNARRTPVLLSAQ
ncbi:MAG: hypothetical protein WD379_06785, partial [Dehalococcoidia bacterium]